MWALIAALAFQDISNTDAMARGAVWAEQGVSERCLQAVANETDQGHLLDDPAGRASTRDKAQLLAGLTMISYGNVQKTREEIEQMRALNDRGIRSGYITETQRAQMDADLRALERDADRAEMQLLTNLAECRFLKTLLRATP